LKKQIHIALSYMVTKNLITTIYVTLYRYLRIVFIMVLPLVTNVDISVSISSEAGQFGVIPIYCHILVNQIVPKLGVGFQRGDLLRDLEGERRDDLLCCTGEALLDRERERPP